jgi:sulfite reductase (NADPH) flavoprotein alpha-component
MAPDVEAALLKAVADHSGKGPDYANEFLAGMKKQKRYLRDIYQRCFLAFGSAPTLCGSA